jgi:hypothetical protein
MSLEQMVDNNFYDLLPEDLQASRKAQIADVIRTGRSVRFEDEREGMILDHRTYPVYGAVTCSPETDPVVMLAWETPDYKVVSFVGAGQR